MRNPRTYLRSSTTFIALLLLLLPSVSAEPLSLNDAPELLAGRQRGFEQNVGQLDPRVSFLLEGPTYHAFIQPDSVVFTWFKRVDEEHHGSQVKPRWHRDATIRMTLDGADPTAVVEGIGGGEVVTSYLSSKYADPAGLRPLQFDKVAARSIYDGIDVEYYLRGQQLEHDFIVAPGADPSLIRLSFDGIDSLELTPDGDLLLVSGEHTLVQQAPFVYQGSLSSPEKVSASYELGANNSVTYVVGDYDRSRRLVIDPIDWTTYAGGNGVEFPIKVEAGLFGDAYLLLFTTSTSFPVTEEGQVIAKGEESEQARLERVHREYKEGQRVRRLEGAVLQEVKGGNVLTMGLEKTLCDTDSMGVAPDSDLIVIGGSGQGLTSTDGTMAGERLDGFVAGIEFSEETPIGAMNEEPSKGALVALFKFLTLLSDETNVQVTNLQLSRGCKNPVTWVFPTGTTGGELDLPGEPANPYQDGGDVFHAAYKLDRANLDLGLRYSHHNYAGTDEFDNPVAHALQETAEDRCELSTVIRPSALFSTETLDIATFNTTSGEFEEGTTQVALGEHRTELIRRKGDYIEMAGTVEGGNLFVKTAMINADTLTNVSTITLGDDTGIAVGLVSHPTLAGGGLALVSRSRACDENSFPNPLDAPFVPLYGGSTQENCTTLTQVLPGGSSQLSPGGGGQKGGGGLQITGRTLLGPGGGSAFDTSADGSYVIAGFTGTDVFGAAKGVDVPKPIRDLSPTGPGDAFAVGGVLDAPWVVTLTGSASFVREPAARGGIITGFSPGFAAEGQSAVATDLPLPNDLLGTVATLTDSAGKVWPLGQFFLNTNQMNAYVPAEAALGLARVEVQAADGSLKIGETLIVETQPNAFTFAAGIGIALTIHLAADGTRTDTDTIATPTIAVGPGERLIFSQFVTGAFAGSSKGAEVVRVLCDGKEMAVLGGAPSPGLLGVGQVAFEVDVPLLGGTGIVQFGCELEVDGVISNSFNIQYDRM